MTRRYSVSVMGRARDAGQRPPFLTRVCCPPPTQASQEEHAALQKAVKGARLPKLSWI